MVTYEVRAETSGAKANELLMGVVDMATYRVKRLNPYQCARPRLDPSVSCLYIGN